MASITADTESVLVLAVLRIGTANARTGSDQTAATAEAADVPVGAFWSISLYNAKGFFEPNDRNAYNVNSVTGTRNDDDSMTVHFGGCEDDRINCLPVMEDWNYIVRMYRPGEEVLKEEWVFPAVEPVQ